MRKFSSLASRVSPAIPNLKIHEQKQPQNSKPSNFSSSKNLGKKASNIVNSEATSTGKPQFKDSNFKSISASQTHISSNKYKFDGKPVDHHYFAEVLSRKDWVFLLSHEFKDKLANLNTRTILSILQNQENPLHLLRFYIWVSDICPQFANNQLIHGALGNALYRKGPVLLSAELIEDIRNSGCRVTQDLLCVLLGSWGRLGLAKHCNDVFEQISYLGLTPSTRLYNAVIDALVKSNSLDLAYLKFQQMEVDACVPDRFTYNILIHGVCKIGVVDEALRLVKQMEGLRYSPNVFTYTILIDGHCNAKRVDEALGILDRMKERNVRPNDATYRSLVNGVFRSVPAHKAIKLLSRWVDMEPKLPKVAYDTILYCLCNISLPRDAVVFLKKAAERGYIPDSSTFNIAMTCFIKGLDLDDTCEIFDCFTQQGMKVDFNVNLALVEALYKSGREGKGNKYLLRVLQEGLVVNVFSYNMVIDCLCKVKMMDRASETFRKMCERENLPNLVTFNTLIAGHCKVGNVVKARELLLKLIGHGFKPDIFTFNSIIDGLCQVNQIIDAFDCFSEMIEWGVTPNTITYNILIRSLCITGDVSKALKLLRKMQDDGIQPDVYSFNALIQSFCRMNKVEKAQRLLTGMLTLDLHPDNFTYIAFIKALCGSRRYHDAKELFLSMEANGCLPDAYLCNSYIDALIKSGQVKEAQRKAYEDTPHLGAAEVIANEFLPQAEDEEETDQYLPEAGIIGTHPSNIVEKALECFHDKHIYSSCDEAYRLTQSGELNVPPEYTDEYCKGPCLTETHHVLDCIDGFLKHYKFYNKATLHDVRETIETGCSYGPKRGDFNVAEHLEAEENRANIASKPVVYGLLLMIMAAWCTLF
ncbi:putative Pentatricopeptide repeat-containing protein [Abeliophyllum distichum]|uniref:Pentatricopeptide repeat-containing protein n=1 Tax=Abeliophyllum distichum TaxID=126358 RepID=A0ABD1NTK8_9LAMI